MFISKLSGCIMMLLRVWHVTGYLCWGRWEGLDRGWVQTARKTPFQLKSYTKCGSIKAFETTELFEDFYKTACHSGQWWGSASGGCCCVWPAWRGLGLVQRGGVALGGRARLPGWVGRQCLGSGKRMLGGRQGPVWGLLPFTTAPTQLRLDRRQSCRGIWTRGVWRQLLMGKQVAVPLLWSELTVEKKLKRMGAGGRALRPCPVDHLDTFLALLLSFLICKMGCWVRFQESFHLGLLL